MWRISIPGNDDVGIKILGTCFFTGLTSTIRAPEQHRANNIDPNKVIPFPANCPEAVGDAVDEVDETCGMSVDGKNLGLHKLIPIEIGFCEVSSNRSPFCSATFFFSRKRKGK